MKTPFGTEVDIGTCHIVLDGFPALRERGTAPLPLLGPCLLWPRSPISATAELLYLLLEQRKLIVWMKIRCSNNIVLQTLSEVNCHEFLARVVNMIIIDVSSVSEHIMKKAVWHAFAQNVDI